MTRDTSRRARLEADADGTITDRRRLALRTLEQLGSATGRELDQAAGTIGLWKRLSELKAEGLAVEDAVRVCRVSGKAALVWRVCSSDEPNLERAHPRKHRCWYVVVRGDDVLGISPNAACAFAIANKHEGKIDVIELREHRKIFEIS